MQERDRKTVTLVLGGVRSGKSRWAQQFAANAARVAYAATAIQFLSIASLFKRTKCSAAYGRGGGVCAGTCGPRPAYREEYPPLWQTFEEPLELGGLIAEHTAGFDVSST